MGWVSPDFTTRSIKTSSIWRGSSTWDLSWVWADRGENLERRHSDCGFGRFGKLDASEVYPRRIKAKEVLITRKGDEFIFPVADGTAKLSGRDYEFLENPLWGGNRPWGAKSSVEKFREGLNRQNVQMTLGLVPTSGRFKVTLIYRHHNEPGVQLFVPKEETFPIPLKYIDVTRSILTLIWTSCKRNVSKVIGMSIRTEVCQIRGQVSRSLPHWMKNLSRDTCGPGRDWQKFKRLPNQIMYGQKYGSKLVKPLRIEKNKNGRTRWQNSTMLEDWEEFTSLILMTKIAKKFPKHARNMARPVAPAMPCKRKAHTSTTKVVAKQENCIPKDSQNDLCLCSGISWIHEATSGVFLTQNMKIALQEKVSLRWPIIIWFTNSLLRLKQWRFGMQKLQWTRKWKKLETISSMSTGKFQE